jgi:hypothetical protein
VTFSLCSDPHWQPTSLNGETLSPSYLGWLLSWLTDQLTLWSWVLLEKLIASHLFQKLQRTLYNRNIHCRVHKSPPPPPLVRIHSEVNPDYNFPLISLQSILILSSHLQVGLPTVYFFHVSPLKTCMHFSIMRATCTAHLTLLHLMIPPISVISLFFFSLLYVLLLRPFSKES